MKKNIAISNQHLILLVIASFSISLVAIGLSFLKSSEKFGTVDIQAILSEQSQQFAQNYPTGRVPQSVMQQAVDEIKAAIDEHGKIQKVTFLAKGAVLSGDLPDYTEELRGQLNEKS
jgi:hypothetical protein